MTSAITYTLAGGETLMIERSASFGELIITSALLLLVAVIALHLLRSLWTGQRKRYN